MLNVDPPCVLKWVTAPFRPYTHCFMDSFAAEAREVIDFLMPKLSSDSHSCLHADLELSRNGNAVF